MYCTYCGKELAGGFRFCPECGKANAPESGPPPGTMPGGGPKRRLSRSMADKKIAGVCAGIASYLGWDVTLVRILFLLGILAHGLSILLYLICWVAMPRDESPAYAAAS